MQVKNVRHRERELLRVITLLKGSIHFTAQRDRLCIKALSCHSVCHSDSTGLSEPGKKRKGATQVSELHSEWHFLKGAGAPGKTVGRRLGGGKGMGAPKNLAPRKKRETPGASASLPYIHSRKVEMYLIKDNGRKKGARSIIEHAPS